ncbi:helix-turn-helix domain-containing protein [Jiella pacifica]|uniref:helix-turn-helix domain-containing protein n=1 Tax=Jiella pacifica TaxID=2696469 RepID=UPI0028AA8021|nr:helix-turn-helix domain-containing protein [Jiella pacifica]
MAGRRSSRCNSRLADAERETLLQALGAENGNISKVARRLGISRPTLYRKLELHGLSRKFV